jgi:ABC-type phosphate transport system auxiliary subunit
MLKKVTVEAAFYSVGSGIVALTAEQAKARLHNLKPVKVERNGAGEYEVVNQLQFKKGESFGYSGVVGKNGQLSDKDAEDLRRMEQAETLEKAVKAARSAAMRQVGDEMATLTVENTRLKVENEQLREQLGAAAKKK